MPTVSTSAPSPTAVVELAPQLYLTLTGQLLRDAPEGARVIRGSAGGAAAGGAAITAIAPLGGGAQQPPTVWEDLADAVTRTFKLSASFKQSAIHALELVGGIAGIVGAVGVVKNLLEMSGLFGHKTTVEEVIKAVWANYAATLAGSKLDHLRSIADHVGVAAGAAAAVTTFKDIPGTRADLLAFQQPLSAACMSLSDRAYQRVIFNPGEYLGLPWMWEWGWLDVPDFVTSSLPAGTEPVLRMVDQPANADRFDYRFVLGSLIFAVTVRVATMHALEPEFRSTGRYRAELQTLCARLRALLNQWLQSIQWSWSPKDDPMPPVSTWPVSGPDVAADYVPVGAVDICSGYFVWTARYVPEWNPNASIDEPEYWAKPYLPMHGGFSGATGPLTNWPPAVKARYYDRADTFRAAARQKVLDESGYLVFAAYVTALCSLTSDPDQSETVAITSRASLEGLMSWRWHQSGREQRTAGGLFCNSQTFEAEIWEKPASVGLTVRTQTPESRTTFLIPYDYFLEAASGRIELAPGQNQELTLEAERFVAERGPAGESRDVPTGWGPVTIRYSLTVEPGQSLVSFSLSPPAGNVRLRFLVEETIQSGRVFQTRRDVSLITRQHRLPTAYFAHVADCEKKTNKGLVELNKRFAISAEPAARFDPRRQTIVEYLTRVQRESPDVFNEVRDRIAGRR